MLEISKQEIINRLYLDNSWWSEEGIGKRYSDMPRRFYYEPFFALVKTTQINRAVVLMGPRRVGKTVMVHHAISGLIENKIDAKRIMYISLETPIFTGLSLEKIVNIFQEEFSYSKESELYIVFDEIQYLPNWEVHLKSLVDSFPAYKFIATGSAAAALRLKSKESGAGRFTDFLLPPLTFAEYLMFIKKESMMSNIKEDPDDEGYILFRADDISILNQEFINYLNYGGYPEAVFSTEIQENSGRFIKSDIIDKVLLRDLPSLYGISDIQELNTLFTTIAYNTGNEVSLEELSQSSGVTKNTLKRYIEYLEAAFLIKIVQRVDDTARTFKRATKFKVYLTNPSMRAALFGPVDANSPAMGALTETAIFSQWFHDQGLDRLHYARWRQGEVDIVWVNKELQKPKWCVEVKWSDLPVNDHRKIKGLISFSKKNNLQDVLVTTKTLYKEKNIDGINVRFFPSAEYTYTLGKNILGLRF